MILSAATATQVDPSGLDLAYLGQYGVVGLIAIVLIVFARTAYKRETDRSDRLEKELSNLNTDVQDKHLAALISATDALRQVTELLKEIEITNKVTRRRNVQG